MGMAISLMRAAMALRSLRAEQREELLVDEAVAGEAAAAVDGLFAVERGEPATRLAREHRRRAEVPGLYARIDHGIDAPQQQVFVPLEVSESPLRVGRLAEPLEQ